MNRLRSRLLGCALWAMAGCLGFLVLSATGTKAGERRVADIATAPWSSIGQVNNEAYGRCTGLLVGRSRVVTAAHCLFNRRTSRFLQPGSIHFVLGYDRGSYRFATVAADVEIGPGYDPSRPGESLASDWAILDLAEPAPAEFTPLTILSEAPPPNSAGFAIAGFARDRPYVMTTISPCRLAGRSRGLLVLTGCRAPRGYSGGPIVDEASKAVRGIVVAKASMKSQALTLAVPASAFDEVASAAE